MVSVIVVKIMIMVKIMVMLSLKIMVVVPLTKFQTPSLLSLQWHGAFPNGKFPSAQPSFERNENLEAKVKAHGPTKQTDANNAANKQTNKCRCV